MIKKLGVVLILLWMVALTGWVLITNFGHPKIVYIDSEKVFTGFQLKKELEVDFDKVRGARQNILDSIANNMQKLSNEAGDHPTQTQVDNFQKQKDDYLAKKKQFDEDNQAYVEKLDNQIWEQMEQYIQDYGEEHKLSYVLGKTGRGNVLYSKKGQDVTEEVIKYINERYNGIKKK